MVVGSWQGFFFGGVFVVQPLAWVWRPQRQEQQGCAWQRAVMVDTCRCVGDVGPGADPSPWQGYLREKGELLRPGGKHRVQAWTVATAAGPREEQCTAGLATCWMVLGGAGCLCRTLTDRSVPLSDTEEPNDRPCQLHLL